MSAQASSLPSGGIASTDPVHAAPPPVTRALPWPSAVRLPRFQALLSLKRRTIVPLLSLSLAAFFAMMLLAGFARPFMAQPVIGAFNVGYAMIVGTYVMCWLVAMIYVWVADSRFDAMAREAVAELKREGGRL